MKNDYLWDRTGSDAEIERLESVLEGLRFRPAEPPALPVREPVLETPHTNWLLRFGLGFAAASAACVTVIIGLTGLGDDPRPLVANRHAPAAISKTAERPAPAFEPEYVRTSAAPQRKPKARVKKKARRDARSIPVPAERRPLPETFTAEERDAYRQLMTALAITGEKLNIVREKLNGTEEDISTDK